MQYRFINVYIKTQNQTGAALLYILFTVAFVGIIGTGILMSTTYGMKSVVTNEQKQQEFYLAEGALEIFLNELDTVDNPDHFLKNNISNSFPYFINGKEILVEVSGEDSTNFYKLTAGYNPAESLIKRSVLIETAQEVNYSMGTPIITGIGNDKTYLPSENVKELNIFQFLWDYVTNNKEELTKMGYKLVEYEGGTLTEVPTNTILYTNNEVEIKNDTLDISGILLAKQISKTGNSDITLNFNGGSIISADICQNNAITGSCPDGSFKGKEHNGNNDKWEITDSKSSTFTCELLENAVKESGNTQLTEQINSVCQTPDSESENASTFNILKFNTQ